MDVLSVTASIVGVVQIFNNAFATAMRGSLADEQVRMLRVYSMNTRVLQYCSGVIQTAYEGPLLETILSVAKECAVIGEKLAYRTDKLTGKNGKRRIAYVLAPFQNLEALCNEFTSYVSLLHSLVQT